MWPLRVPSLLILFIYPHKQDSDLLKLFKIVKTIDCSLVCLVFFLNQYSWTARACLFSRIRPKTRLIRPADVNVRAEVRGPAFSQRADAGQMDFGALDHSEDRRKVRQRGVVGSGSHSLTP